LNNLVQLSKPSGIKNINLKKVNLYLAHLVVFLLPFEQKLIPLALILFAFSNLLVHPFHERVHYFKKRKFYIWLFSAFYLAHVIGVLYSDDFSTGLFDLEIKLSLLLVPWVVLTSNVINKYTLPELLRTFLYATVLAAIVSFVYAGISYFKSGEVQSFYYVYLSYYRHAGYFSIYVNFAIAVLIIFIFHNREKVQIHNYLMLTFLIITVYQLSARMGIIVLGFLLTYAFSYLIFPKIRFKNPLIALSLVVLFTAGFITISINYVDRFKGVTENVKNEESSSGSRPLLWKYSWELFKEKPLLGYGTGDVSRVMNEKWGKEEFDYAEERHLNAHNQFVQSGVALGLLGLLPLIGMLVIPLLKVNVHSNFIFPLFIFIITMSCLTEAIFERQDGVVFFALFNSFLYFTYSD
jgi:O-antigen ligase